MTAARALILLRPRPDTLRERIGELVPNRRRFRLALFGAACAHAGLVSFVADARPGQRARETPVATEWVVELGRPEPAPPAPTEEQLPRPEVRPVAEHRAERAAPRAPPTEAARAGAVLTKIEPSEQPLDLTDTVVTGVGQHDPGGSTSAQGRSQRFSRAVAAPGPTQTPPRAGNSHGAASGPDLSSGPSVLGGLAWDCPFPADADVDGVNRAQVTLSVEVDAQGRPTRVRALSNPGHGFAESARSCALRKRWSPGTDRSGRPSTTAVTLNVRFVR